MEKPKYYKVYYANNKHDIRKRRAEKRHNYQLTKVRDSKDPIQMLKVIVKNEIMPVIHPEEPIFPDLSANQKKFS